MVEKPPEPIVAVGTIALDTVITPWGKAENVLGGSGMYFAVAASILAPVNLVGVVGEDFDQWEELNRPNLDLEGVATLPGKTFRWGGKYRENVNLRDTLYTELGVTENYDFQVPESYLDCGTVCLANIDPPTQLKLIHSMRNPTFVVADTMNLWIQSDRENLLEVICRCDVLILNDEEARQLTGKLNLVEALEEIQGLGPRTVVVKKGDHGAIAALGSELFAIPAYPLKKVVDPTGAGDCFVGGFAGYIQRAGSLSHAAMRSAVVFGSAMASFCCEDFSIKRINGLSLAELEARVEFIRELVHFD